MIIHSFPSLYPTCVRRTSQWAMSRSIFLFLEREWWVQPSFIPLPWGGMSAKTVHMIRNEHIWFPIWWYSLSLGCSCFPWKKVSRFWQFFSLSWFPTSYTHCQQNLQLFTTESVRIHWSMRAPEGNGSISERIRGHTQVDVGDSPHYSARCPR